MFYTTLFNKIIEFHNLIVKFSLVRFLTCTNTNTRHFKANAFYTLSSFKKKQSFMSKPMTNSKIQCTFNAEICRTVHTKLDNCSVVHTPAENWIMFAFHWDIHPPSNKISVVGIVLIRLTVYTTCTSSVHTMYIMFSYVWPTQLASTDTQLCHVPAYSVWLVWLWCMKMMFQQQTGATQTTIKYKVRWSFESLLDALVSCLYCELCNRNWYVKI